MRRINVAFLLLGGLALAWMIHHVGLATLRRGLAEVGAGFVLSCGAHFAALALDSVTLRAVTGHAGRAVPYLTYLRVSLAGHAINEATPLAKLGELTKFTMLSDHVPTDRAAAALIVQNFVMGVMNCGLIAIAPPLVVLTMDVDGRLAALLWITGGVFALLGAALLVLMARGPGELPFRLARRVGFATARVDRWRDGWRGIEGHWHEATADRSRMRIAWLSGAASRAMSVVEAAIILHLLGAHHVVSVAMVSTASFQLILWTTSFVPLQAGTAEGSAYVLFARLGLSPTTGVLLELVRKVRRLVFIGIGVTVLGVSAFRDVTRGKTPDAD